MNDQRLEEYLQAMEQHLDGVSPEARREWREEAHGHLLALVEAHEELGASRAEAVEAALKQFGNEKQIGRALASATRHAEPVPFREAAWCLGALFWNAWLYRMCMESELQFPPAVLGVGIALGHLGTALVLARVRSVRLSRWAVRVPFVIYAVFNVLFTGTLLSALLRGGPAFQAESGGLLLVLGVNWACLAYCFSLPRIIGRRKPKGDEETALVPHVG